MTNQKIFALFFLIWYSGHFFRNYLLHLSDILGLFADLVICLILPLVFMRMLYLDHRSLFLKISSDVRWSGIGIFVSFLLGITSAYILYMTGYWSANYFHYDFHIQDNLILLAIKQYGVFGVFYLAFTAGIFEELLFKSVLIRCFNKEPSKFIFVASSVVLFGALHYWHGPLAALIIAMLYGLPTSIYYYYKRNILNLIVVHSVGDLLTFIWVWGWMDKGLVH